MPWGRYVLSDCFGWYYSLDHSHPQSMITDPDRRLLTILFVNSFVNLAHRVPHFKTDIAIVKQEIRLQFCIYILILNL